MILGHTGVSVARMQSPEGWESPASGPIEEITVVSSGLLRVDHEGGALDVRAGQAAVAAPGERIRYSSPEPAAPRTWPSARRPSRRPLSIATREVPRAIDAVEEP